MNQILQGDCHKWMHNLLNKQQQFNFIFADVPFNTGQTQKGRSGSYTDEFTPEEYRNWIRRSALLSRDLLTYDGSFMIMADYREAAYIQVECDYIFSRDKLRNQLIWAFDYGGRPRDRWANKHNIILWYTKSDRWTFNLEECDRIPYMAPSLVGAEKAERGKYPTSVQWHTICPTNGFERTGYPTQKPVGLLKRFMLVHTNPGDNVLDFCAGSGTTGEAAASLGRNFTLIDNNPEAIAVMQRRLARWL